MAESAHLGVDDVFGKGCGRTGQGSVDGERDLVDAAVVIEDEPQVA